MPMLAALAVITACIFAFDVVCAARMPESIVIFPVGASERPPAGSMPPTAFNHAVHARWMQKQRLECAVCHHTGDPVACTACHKVDGGEMADGVTLFRAMHSRGARKPEPYKPSSCVGCHTVQLEQRDCAGCHKTIVRPRREGAWCNVCHSISPSMTRAQLAQGIGGSLPAAENARMAAETVSARKPVEYFSPMLAPYKVRIDSLKGKFGPCNFTHRRHVTSLMDRISDSRLAGAFHTDPATICMACHHNSPPSATPPRCASCHSPSINPKRPGRVALQSAYHLLCMSCHTDMNVARPRNTDCESCHRPVRSAGIGKGTR